MEVEMDKTLTTLHRYVKEGARVREERHEAYLSRKNAAHEAEADANDGDQAEGEEGFTAAPAAPPPRQAPLTKTLLTPF